MTKQKMFLAISKAVIEIRNSGVSEDDATTKVINGMQKYSEKDLKDEKKLKFILRNIVLTA